MRFVNILNEIIFSCTRTVLFAVFQVRLIWLGVYEVCLQPHRPLTSRGALRILYWWFFADSKLPLRVCRHRKWQMGNGSFVVAEEIRSTKSWEERVPIYLHGHVDLRPPWTSWASIKWKHAKVCLSQKVDQNRLSWKGTGHLWGFIIHVRSPHKA